MQNEHVCIVLDMLSPQYSIYRTIYLSDFGIYLHVSLGTGCHGPSPCTWRLAICQVMVLNYTDIESHVTFMTTTGLFALAIMSDVTWCTLSDTGIEPAACRSAF